MMHLDEFERQLRLEPINDRACAPIARIHDNLQAA